MNSVVGAVGTFTTDGALVVQTWDTWMAAATGISEVAACGEALSTLYPELAERGFLGRLRRVATGSAVEVLSPALHKYFIPCAPMDPASHFERMRQHVVIAPIHDTLGSAGVSVTIEDVTARFDLERRAAADLDSRNESTRVKVATELAHDSARVSMLADALADDSWRVRRIAADGLAESDQRTVIDTLLSVVRDHHQNPALLNSALTALGRTRQDIVLDVIPLLGDGDTDARMYAALALGLIGDVSATPALLALLARDVDANVRFHAVEALGRIGDPRAADDLAALAATRDFFLSFAALDALAAIGDASVAPLLLPLLDDAFLAPAVVACLGTIGADDVVAPLVATLGRDAALSGVVASALAAIASRCEAESGDGDLVAALVRSLATSNDAAAVLGAIEGASDDDILGLVLVASWLSHDGVDRALAAQLRREPARRLAADRLARRGVGAAGFVEAVAGDAEAEVQRAAAAALGGIGSATSIPVLLAMLDGEPEAPVLIAAATALGGIGDTRAFSPLFSLLDHPDATVRQAVVGALNSIAHPEMETRVIAALSAESPRVRECAARIAGYFTYDAALSRVLSCCSDGEALVRRAAVESLATYEDASAAAAIQQAVISDVDGTVRAAAARALSRSASQASQALLASALEDANLWVRYYSARACVRIEGLLPGLRAALVGRVAADRAAPVRVAAIEALGSAEVQEALGLLVDAAGDVDDDVSVAALRALSACSMPKARSAVVEALRAGTVRQQHAALDAISSNRVVGQRLLPELIRMVRDPRDPEMRSHAIATIGVIGGQSAITALLSLAEMPALSREVVRALASGDQSRASELGAALGSATESAKALLVAALGRIRDARSAKIIASLLDDPSAMVRRIAVWTLARMDRQQAG